VNTLPDGISIKELTFAQLQNMRPNIAGWIYPRSSISQFIPLFSRTQRAALNLYGWLAILMIPLGAALALYLGSWWWLLLVVGAYVVWKANRKSMEDFFVENLKENSSFYEAIKQTREGDLVKVVLRKE